MLTGLKLLYCGALLGIGWSCDLPAYVSDETLFLGDLFLLILEVLDEYLEPVRSETSASRIQSGSSLSMLLSVAVLLAIFSKFEIQ